MKKLPRGVVWLLLVFSAHAWSEGRFIAVEGAGEIEKVPGIIRISYNIFQVHKNAATAKAKVEDISSRSVRALARAARNAQQHEFKPGTVKVSSQVYVESI